MLTADATDEPQPEPAEEEPAKPRRLDWLLTPEEVAELVGDHLERPAALRVPFVQAVLSGGPDDFAAALAEDGPAAALCLRAAAHGTLPT